MCGVASEKKGTHTLITAAKLSALAPKVEILRQQPAKKLFSLPDFKVVFELFV